MITYYLRELYQQLQDIVIDIQDADTTNQLDQLRADFLRIINKIYEQGNFDADFLRIINKTYEQGNFEQGDPV